MRSQVRLLEMLVWLWDHEFGMFDLEGEKLELTIENIYFVTRLYHQGALVNLGGTGHGGDPLSVQYYVNTYFFPST